MRLKYDKQGLIPVIIQDYKTGEVLMLAYMNKLALKKTINAGKTHFFSRSRRKLWLKGETSGHYQKVCEILFDCDKDTLLIKVRQKVGACHMGYKSCFYRSAGKKGRILKITGKKIFEPGKVYKKK